jgi:hypothetical protein
MGYLRVKLGEIIEACEGFQKKAAKAAHDDLSQKTWPRPIQEALENIAIHLLRGEFKKIIALAETIRGD